MIYAKDIKDLNHVKNILDRIKNEIQAYIDSFSSEYVSSEHTEKCRFQLCEIDEFIIGLQKYNESNIYNSDLRIMNYWEYIDGELSFEEMLGEIKKYEGEI